MSMDSAKLFKYKIQNGRHKHRSGKHSLASQKNARYKKIIKEAD
jgi:hypothetical protein